MASAFAAPPLPLLRLLRPPPPFPGSGPSAQPRSRRERSAAPRACGLGRALAPLAGREWAGGLAAPYFNPAPRCSPAVPEKASLRGGARKAQQERSCYSLLLPLMTKFNVAVSGPNPKQVVIVLICKTANVPNLFFFKEAAPYGTQLSTTDFLGLPGRGHPEESP